MAGFKESISKGITTINLKTNNFVEESKCKTYITSLENEIANLETALGKSIYEKYKAGVDYKEGMEEQLKVIQSKYDEIEAQKQTIEKLKQEERQVLGTGTDSSVIYCSNCGAQSAVGFKFCSKCGTPLN